MGSPGCWASIAKKAKAPPAFATGPPLFLYVHQYIRGSTLEKLPAVTGGRVD